jgi:hypothetical protein
MCASSDPLPLLRQRETELGLIAQLPTAAAFMGAMPMPQYIMLVNFTDQGLKGDVPNRQDKSRDTAKQFGVERKTVWMTFGSRSFAPRRDHDPGAESAAPGCRRGCRRPLSTRMRSGLCASCLVACVGDGPPPTTTARRSKTSRRPHLLHEQQPLAPYQCRR